jgi:CRP-like cAMP-binding protein
VTEHDHKWRALANFARNSELLSLVDNEGLGRLVQHAEIEFVEPGSTIVRQGDVGNSFYLVVVGELSVLVREVGPDPVAKLGPGTFFGEIAVVTHQPRTATVVAATPAELISFPREALVELIGRYPQLREHLSRVGLQRSEANLEQGFDDDIGLAELLEGEHEDETSVLNDLFEESEDGEP